MKTTVKQGLESAMQYDGFISTIIDRSEQLLSSDTKDDLQVTRMLLVLNTGFSIVWDRIQYWDDSDDEGLRRPNTWSKMTKARKRKLAAPVDLHGQTIFESFRTCGDFAYFKISKSDAVKTLNARNTVGCINNAEEVPLAQLSLDSIMRAVRNSFAHGGILPMSPNQAGNRRRSVIPQLIDSEEIDRVYFVSKWIDGSPQEHFGWIVMEFGLDALRLFWDDWKALLLLPGNGAFLKLDQVA